MSIAVEDASNYVIGTDIGKHGNCFDEPLVRMPIVVSTSAARYPSFRMQAAFPMDHENDLAPAAVNIGYDFLYKCAHDPLLEACIGMRIVPD
jgi:hypothetical protein